MPVAVLEVSERPGQRRVTPSGLWRVDARFAGLQTGIACGEELGSSIRLRRIDAELPSHLLGI